MEGVWTTPGRCWKVSGGFLEGVGKMSGKRLEDIWKMSGG